MSEVRTAAGRDAVRMRGLFGGETERRASEWVGLIEAEARREALDAALAAVLDVRFRFAAFPGDGADGDGPLGDLIDAVIQALTELRDGTR